MDKVLEVRDLNVWLGNERREVHVVRGASFDIEAGETFCIVGESGSGKSITSLSIMGLLPNPSRRHATRISFQGHDIRNVPQAVMADIRGDRLAMIFQDPMTSLNPYHTIGSQLEEVWRRHRGRSRKARERAYYLLERVHISDPGLRLSQYPHQLSGGLRQRVMIAMALMCEPALVIADEPTTALDVSVQAEVLNLLSEVQAEFGLAILLITHDFGVVSRIARRVAVMYAGQFVEVGTTHEVLATPKHPYTRALIGSMPKVKHVDSNITKLKAIRGTAPSLTESFSGCAFFNRCDEARELCRESEISLFSLKNGHQHRCRLEAAREAIPRDEDATS